MSTTMRLPERFLRLLLDTDGNSDDEFSRITEIRYVTNGGNIMHATRKNVFRDNTQDYVTVWDFELNPDD